METKIGTIKSVSNESGNTRGRDWTRFVFKFDDDQILSTFDQNIGAVFKAGQKVKMTGEQKGKFWNMETMQLDDGIPEKDEGIVLEPVNQTTNDLLRQILAELKELNDKQLSPED